MRTICSLLLALCCAAALRAGGEVEIVRAPDGAVQPHVVADAQGTLHLVYFLVDPATTKRKRFMQTGDLFYATRAAGADGWSEPLRVNHRRSMVSRMSAPRIAVSGTAEVHVAWSRFQPRGMWYTRLRDDGVRFAKARNLLTKDALGIEAGPALAADGDGNVWVVWHQGAFKDEASRIVAVRHSADGGRTFAPARPANPSDLGVCSCCNLHAVVDTSGALHVSFRASVDGIHKDMVLLASTDRGETYEDRLLDTWEHPGCPTSGTYLAPGSANTLVAWETKGVVFLGDVEGAMRPVAMPRSASLQKHPTLAVNHEGEALVAWIELSKKPVRKSLEWRVFDANGKPTSVRSEKRVILTNTNSPGVAARPDGTFVVVY